VKNPLTTALLAALSSYGTAPMSSTLKGLRQFIDDEQQRTWLEGEA